MSSRGLRLDLYKNPREDRPQDSIQYAVAFGANFGMMIQRHFAMKKRFPDRLSLCLLLISSAAEILGFPTIFSQCEQSVRVRQTLAKFLGR